MTLAPELPGDIASLAQLAASAVELFERVHLVTDPAFWRRLVKERERRAAEIEQVRMMYMTAGTLAMPSLQALADLHDALLVIGFFRELARLFDVQRVVNLMHRAGLDPSNFATVYTPTPKAWWETVAREIRQGAVSEPLRSLRELARAAGEELSREPRDGSRGRADAVMRWRSGSTRRQTWLPHSASRRHLPSRPGFRLRLRARLRRLTTSSARSRSRFWPALGHPDQF